MVMAANATGVETPCGINIRETMQRTISVAACQFEYVKKDGLGSIAALIPSHTGEDSASVKHQNGG
jgi:phosphomevalonate kinase